jgi:hypothetical protein
MQSGGARVGPGLGVAPALGVGPAVGVERGVAPAAAPLLRLGVRVGLLPGEADAVADWLAEAEARGPGQTRARLVSRLTILRASARDVAEMPETTCSVG